MSKEDLPGGVSGQNREEAEPGHGSGGERKGSEDDKKDGKRSGRESGAGGEAGEGSQSSGDPKGAG